jgi:hypothetical protein
MERVFAGNKLPYSQRKLMVGVMTSYSVLKGLHSEWSNIWLSPNELSTVFVGGKLLLNTIHYADYASGTTQLDDLKEITVKCGRHLHAIQLDMIWPSPRMVKEYRAAHPDIKVVLQIPQKAFTLMDESPVAVCRKIQDYGQAVDYVLLDRSMGRGKVIEPSTLESYIKELSSKLPDLGIAIAGRLAPSTLYLIEDLVKENPNLSTDTQSGVRRSGNSKDPVDWDYAEEYLVKSLQILK